MKLQIGGRVKVVLGKHKGKKGSIKRRERVPSLQKGAEPQAYGYRVEFDNDASDVLYDEELGPLD